MCVTGLVTFVLHMVQNFFLVAGSVLINFRMFWSCSLRVNLVRSRLLTGPGKEEKRKGKDQDLGIAIRYVGGEEHKLYLRFFLNDRGSKGFCDFVQLTMFSGNVTGETRFGFEGFFAVFTIVCEFQMLRFDMVHGSTDYDFADATHFLLGFFISHDQLLHSLDLLTPRQLAEIIIISFRIYEKSKGKVGFRYQG